MSLLKKAQEEKRNPKILFWGTSGTGKTTHASNVALEIGKHLGKAVAFLDSENVCGTLLPKFQEAGVDLYVHQGSDPREALKFLAECEASADVGCVLIDNMTDFIKQPRKQWLLKSGKDAIPLSKYVGIDMPFHAFVEHLKWVKMPVVYTMRGKYQSETGEDKDDTALIPDGGGAEYIARVKCRGEQMRRKGQAPDIRFTISDDSAPGKLLSATNPEQELWTKLVAKFF